MGYSAQDEQFIHQVPRPLDQVHDDDNSWSDRCYFNTHSPDGRMLATISVDQTMRLWKAPALAETDR